MFDDGYKIEGFWTNDIRDGEATAVDENGKVVKSHASYDYRTDKITITWDSGNSYTGNWKDDLRNGYGTDKYFDGSNFVECGHQKGQNLMRKSA